MRVRELIEDQILNIAYTTAMTTRDRIIRNIYSERARGHGFPLQAAFFTFQEVQRAAPR